MALLKPIRANLNLAPFYKIQSSYFHLLHEHQTRHRFSKSRKPYDAELEKASVRLVFLKPPFL